MAVDQAGVGQRPEMLRGLEFGRVGRQEDQMDMVGHAQGDARRFPACAVEDERKLLVGLAPT
ncbi:MAG TPA: hypothetical protein VFQ25_05965 [Ktedonobacterales bacterium]|nr:hypothetical protein [Ktedonobacterales bacterium]